MPKCCVKHCKNMTSRILKKDGINYFRFPRDPVRCEKWLTIVTDDRGEKNYNLTKSSVVCSVHFAEKDMYVTDKGLKRLHKSAYPTRNLTRSEPPKSICKEHKNTRELIKNLCEISVPEDDSNIGDDVEDNDEEKKPKCCSLVIVNDEATQLDLPSAIDDQASVTSSISESDSLQVKLLKKELTKLKKKLADKERSIKNIRRKNAKLLKRYTSLKTAVALLTKKWLFIKRGVRKIKE